MRKQKTKQQKIRNTHRNYENIFQHKADKQLEVLHTFLWRSLLQYITSIQEGYVLNIILISNKTFQKTKEYKWVSSSSGWQMGNMIKHLPLTQDILNEQTLGHIKKQGWELFRDQNWRDIPKRVKQTEHHLRICCFPGMKLELGLHAQKQIWRLPCPSD